MSAREVMIIYYNPRTDQLGIGGITWDYMVSLQFVPIVKNPRNITFENGYDPERLGTVENEIAIEKTPEWVEIGEF